MFTADIRTETIMQPRKQTVKTRDLTERRRPPIRPLIEDAGELSKLSTSGLVSDLNSKVNSRIRKTHFDNFVHFEFPLI